MVICSQNEEPTEKVADTDADPVLPSYSVTRKETISQTLRSLVENSTFSDVTFCVEGEYVAAHRFPLAVRSDVFKAMFYGPASTENKIIKVDDISMDTFKIVLLYIYTDQINIMKQNVIELLYAAHKYNLGFLEDKCERFIESNKSVVNALLVYGQLYHFDAFLSLKMSMLSYICDNFYERFSDPECFTVIHSVECLKYLMEKIAAIEHEPDHGRFEYDLFEMIVRWAKMKCRENHVPEDAVNIRKYLDGVEEFIRFSKMNLEVLGKCSSICPEFFSSEEMSQYMKQMNHSTEMVYQRALKPPYLGLFEYKGSSSNEANGEDAAAGSARAIKTIKKSIGSKTPVPVPTSQLSAFSFTPNLFTKN